MIPHMRAAERLRRGTDRWAISGSQQGPRSGRRAALGVRFLGREIHLSPRREPARLPACYFVCERNFVGRMSFNSSGWAGRLCLPNAVPMPELAKAGRAKPCIWPIQKGY
jgi:hypothetical protein